MCFGLSWPEVKPRILKGGEEIEMKGNQKDIPSLLTGALISLHAAKDSDYWSYTREYALGKLDVAINIVRELIEFVEAGSKVSNGNQR